ncbi:MAG: hypothetical protein NO076_06625 [Sulfolobales archaeon]|nr:hypothetical protein [Sulfolobales archaeon]
MSVRNSSVRNFFKEDLLKEIVRVKPDALAPSLGSVILAIGEGRIEEGETPYYKPSVFFELTYPSDNFMSVLRSVVETLRNRGFASIFLNLDMGSGKTHLLTLLLHLFASYNLAPEQLSGYLDDYKSKTGYDENLARKTVVFAFDLRTPKLATMYLKLTEIFLSKLENYDAANLVKRAYEEDTLPDAKELAKKIDKNLNLLILIDELHYAAISNDIQDRKIAADVVKFVLDLVNYRRTLYGATSGIAIVVASSRRDFDRWLEIRDLIDPRFRVSIEGFIDQMQRIESTTQARWLSLDEAKRVLEKRLGLRKGEFEEVFHKSFDKFIERVVKADSDVPDAQHLRSLIKAMAIYALEAYDHNDSIVSPARFTEDVIDLLLPANDVANRYRSIHAEIVNSLKSSARREEVLLAVNSIFSLTITGAPKKLLEMLRVAKETETLPQDIPVVREVELSDILKAHGLSDSTIYEVVKDLDTLHANIHRVSLAGKDYGYFVVPYVSPLAMFLKMRSDEYKELMGDPNNLAERICEEDLLRLEYSDDFSELKAIESLQELEKTPHPPDKFYIYIYVNTGLLKQLSAEEQTIDNSFNTMKKEAKEFLARKGAHNLVIVLPRITKEAIEGKAYSLAVDSAASYVINKFIAPQEKGESQDEITRKLLEIELGDLKAEIGRRLNEALATFTSSLRSIFAEALYFTPNGVMSEPITLDNIKRREVKVYEIQTAIDTFRKGLSDVIADVSRALVDRVKNGLIILPSPDKAVEAVYKDIEEDLKRNWSTSFRVDAYRIQKLTEDRWIYIPPKVMEQISKSVIERVENAFKDRYEVGKRVEEEGKKYTIKVVPIAQQTQQPIKTSPSPQLQPQLSPSLSPWEALKGLIDSLAEKGGMIWVKIEVNKESAERIKRYLSLLKDHIKESKEATEQAKGP